jgi:hypothetical protein
MSTSISATIAWNSGSHFDRRAQSAQARLVVHTFKNCDLSSTPRSILNPPTLKFNPALNKATRESEFPSRLSVRTGQSSPEEEPTSSHPSLSGAKTGN